MSDTDTTRIEDDASHIERLAEIGRAFAESGRWDTVVIDGTRSRPVLRITHNNSRLHKAAFSKMGPSLLTGHPHITPR